MCRLYGFRASERTKVECTLVHAQNALLVQSRLDSRGESNADGWGIACYEDGLPLVEKRSAAAFEDLHFGLVAERMYARTVVAHVRNATVGARGPENVHPFVCGRWTFAHNGTVEAFEALEPLLLERTPPELRAHRRGTTDSELAFLWLLGQLRRVGVVPGARCEEPLALARALGEALRTLDGLAAEHGACEPCKLNFLLTDGHLLAATRWNRELFWVERHEVRDCEICGIPHVEHAPGAAYRAVVVASEPISDEAWREVPEGGVLLVGDDVRVEALPPRAA